VSRSTRNAGPAVVVVVVVAVVAIAAARLVRHSSPSSSTSQAALSTATVKRMDLAQTTPVSGTVGYASPSTIVQPAGTGPQAVTQAQQSVAQAQGNVAADQQSLMDTNAADTQGATQAQQALAAGQGQAKLAADQLALSNARSALSTAEAAATAYDQTSKYTALPAVGQVISPGQSLWSIDGRPVLLVAGTLVAWRAFRAGMSAGSDVAALDQALIDLGLGGGLTVSDVFSDATAAAIDRFQASLGLPQTGSLALGSAVFEPAAVRVTAVHPLVGSSVGGGQPVLDVTSTTPVVNVALPVDRTYLVKVGDPVSVNLPDGTTGEGTITAVGTVATSTTPANSGNNNTSATVNVMVSMTRTSAAGSLDQAPVTVDITNSSAHQVLAVPTTALLALSGGGYALEVAKPDGTHQLVDVTTGIFDDQSGMVQVSGPGVAAGQQVVVAA